jgi:prolyl-tRNA editing enzyme YbaK/EbsC (Cys-tRNA(Pro) deacylase)
MDTIQTFLDNSNLEYEFIFHEKQIYSAADGAKYFNINPGQTAPTLILESERRYFSLVFSGIREHVDFKEIAKLLNVSKIKLAKKEKVHEITGFFLGDTPMVGLPFLNIFDKKLLQYPFIFGGSGQANRTLKISPSALETLNNPFAYLEDN